MKKVTICVIPNNIANLRLLISDEQAKFLEDSFYCRESRILRIELPDGETHYINSGAVAAITIKDVEERAE